MLLPAFKFFKRVKLFRSTQFKTHLLVSLFYILTFCPQLPDSISVSLNVIHVTQFQGNCRGIHFLPESQFLFNFSSGSKTMQDLSLLCYGGMYKRCELIIQSLKGLLLLPPPPRNRHLLRVNQMSDMFY